VLELPRGHSELNLFRSLVPEGRILGAAYGTSGQLSALKPVVYNCKLFYWFNLVENLALVQCSKVGTSTVSNLAHCKMKIDALLHDHGSSHGHQLASWPGYVVTLNKTMNLHPFNSFLVTNDSEIVNKPMISSFP
jgi:hypothetical protein